MAVFVHTANSLKNGSCFQHMALFHLSDFLSLKAGLPATICWPDLSAWQYRSTNCTCIFTLDSQLIHKNENRLDSENLLQCIRFLSSQADILKEAITSIKIHRVRCQNTCTIHAPILSGGQIGMTRSRQIVSSKHMQVSCPDNVEQTYWCEQIAACIKLVLK